MDLLLLRMIAERVAIAALIAAIWTAVVWSLPRETILQGWMSDAAVSARASVFGERPLDSQHVLVVGMDRRSLESPELKARPRAMFSPVYAELAGKVFSYGARGLMMDMIMAYDAKDLEIDGGYPLRRYDVPFLTLLRSERESGRVVLGWSAGLPPARRFVGAAGTRGMAMVEVPLGTSNVVRRVPTRNTDSDGTVHPTLSGRALALLGLPDPGTVNIMAPGSLTSLPSASLIDLLRCGDADAVRRMVEGRIVFLGGMLPGEDRLKTADQMIEREIAERPRIHPADQSIACSFPPPPSRIAGEATLPGVYTHAAAVDAIASGWQPERAGRAAVLGFAFAVSFATALLALLVVPLSAVLLAGAVIGGAFLGSVWLLDLGIFLPTAWAITGAAVSFLAAYGLRIRILDRQANRIRRAFGRYLSPVLVKQMIREGERPDMRGETRDVTVLFADLTGFTRASQTLPSQVLMTVLNRYLEVIAGALRERGGYIDKFIGDSAMAIFNAPARLDDHAAVAVAAALDIRDRVSETASEDRGQGRQSFDIKIGIATGPATVGNVGSHDRINYTVVGERVNFAARLEALPSRFRTPILIGPETAARVRGKFLMLRVARIRAKGVADGRSIWAPLGTIERCPSGWRSQVDRYHAALDAFAAGDFIVAATAWQALSSEPWPGAAPARVMEGEARIRTNKPSGTGWDGTLDADSK